MASFNRVIMMGNLTRDPEHRQLPSGQSVCRLGLASNRQFKNRQSGEMVQEVCFVDIDVWGPQADSCNQYLQKGRAILVEGRLKLDSWEDGEGQKRTKHSIVADRVTFLSVQQDVDTPQEERPEKPEPKEEPTEPKPAEPKPAEPKPAEPKEDKKEKPESGEVDFSDEKPFEDDLPF